MIDVTDVARCVAEVGRHRVVAVGGGFGGLDVTEALTRLHTERKNAGPVAEATREIPT